MAGDTVITVVGNLTGDPELRFTPNGAAVANFTIASTPRNFDRASGEWKEGETLFMRATVWNEQAENTANSLRKGARVIALGNMVSRSYEDKEGNRRTSIELQAKEVAPSLRFATAQVQPNQRNNGGYGNQQGGQYNQQQGNPQGGYQQHQNQQPPQQGGADPWGNQSGGNYDWGGGANDEPPF